jgi:hypothetical protein
MAKTWIYDENAKKRVFVESTDDVRRGKFHQYAQAVANLPKGVEFVNAAREITKDDETAKRYNRILEGEGIVKPHKQITETWARHCSPTDDLKAEIASTGQEIGANVFRRIDRLFQATAQFADREPFLPFRVDRLLLRSRLQTFRSRLCRR